MLPSIFSIIKIGIGPSSSHTLGPMKAARDFCAQVASSAEISNYLKNYLENHKKASKLKIQIELLGSLALTGKGHLTHVAVVAGLTGLDPRLSPIEEIHNAYNLIKESKLVKISKGDEEDLCLEFGFDIEKDLVFNPITEGLRHPNTLSFKLIDEASGTSLMSKDYRSVGGGALEGDLDQSHKSEEESSNEIKQVLNTGNEFSSKAPDSMTEIIEECQKSKKGIVDFIYEYEGKYFGRSKEETDDKLEEIWSTIQASIKRGLSMKGTLPGGLELARRAKEMHEKLNAQFSEKLKQETGKETTESNLNLSKLAGTPAASIYALAVSEENAAGGRIVTTPTCGAAGIVPATLKYLQEKFDLSDEKIYEGIMLAGIFGATVAKNASISGSEVGCQGEVGTASAMAAAAACHLQGGDINQIEAAAETALEHHLGLTCDPVMGLVQIPCIERNAAGTIAALNAADMALLGSGNNRISFDEVVETMMQIGKDMHHKYKETALGGLAATKKQDLRETDHMSMANVDC